jgi:parvulin-like peptidyl-prolyl cis-trans isomerase-like protein
VRAVRTPICMVPACVAVLCVVVIGGCGNGSAEVVARVGDTAITRGTVEHWIAVTATMSPATRALAGDPQSDTTPQQRALSVLIYAQRTIGEAREAGIEASDREAGKALERLRFERSSGLSVGQPPAVQALITGNVETRADQVLLVKVRMLAERMEQRQLAEAEQRITHAQILGYYTENKRSFVVPERRNVAVIETFRKAKSDLARREIEAGKPLLSVLERRNDEADVGGYKLGLTRRALIHTYERNYFSARPHVLVGPLKSEIYYLFEVTAVMPARQQALAEVQQIIRRKLIAGRQRRVFTSLVRALNQSWRSKTRCRPAYIVDQCGAPLA